MVFPQGSTSIRLITLIRLFYSFYICYVMYMIIFQVTHTIISKIIILQDPGTTPARRIWTSIDVGTEIFVSDKDEEAEWSLSDFDVLATD